MTSKDIIGKWTAIRRITCQRGLNVEIDEDFDVIEILDSDVAIINKGKDEDRLQVGILPSSAKKK